MPDSRVDAFKPRPQQTSALSAENVLSSLSPYRGWSVEDEAILRKTFSFENHYEVQAFVNAVMWVSHRQDHHPDMLVGFKAVTVRYTTHELGGKLSQKDLFCAMKLETLMQL